ncbi:hypothetical protein [Salinisphaera sp. G21_0]|uniref:hypothetical protein n=1 Tax=Salinisphaera sp. G21_0 TaxID=2821094 RepID=UPI001ADC7F31|nr:hypothetical protein [Salinisphaera sp. G21_0]MBO9483723.1 hypothetical protein [Salinisphaera sp. G21_0]
MKAKKMKYQEGMLIIHEKTMKNQCNPAKSSLIKPGKVLWESQSNRVNLLPCLWKS